MAIFLLSGFVSFLFVTGLITLRSYVNELNPKNLIVRGYRDLYKIEVSRKVLFYCSIGAISGSIIGLYILTVSFILETQSNLYYILERLTSDLFSKGLLGLIFGWILAAWVLRNYHKPPHFKTGFIQKLEGVLLLILFILGTTTVSIEDIVRGFKFDQGKIGFQISASSISDNQSDGGAKSTEPGGDLDSISEDNGLTAGFRLIREFGAAIKKDINYIEAFNNTEKNPKLDALKEVSKSYSSGLSKLVVCSDAILKKTNDQQSLVRDILNLRPALGAVLSNLNDDKLNQYSGGRQNQYKIRLGKSIDELKIRIKTTSDHLYQYGGVLLGIPECLYLRSINIDIPTIGHKSTALRPYLSTIYASLFYIDGQRLRAIEILNNSATEIINNAEKTIKSDNNMTAYPEFWYSLRALANLLFITEDYIDKSGKKTPLRIRTLYLDRIQDFLDTIRYIDPNLPFTSLFDLYALDGVKGRTLSKNRFQRNPGFVQNCPTGASFAGPLNQKIATTLSYSYITSQSLFLYRSLEHPKFQSRYSKQGKQISELIANIDLNCAAIILGHPPEAVKFQRVEFLRIYVLHQLKLASIKKNIGAGYKAWMKNTLLISQNAIKTALEINGADKTSTNKYSIAVNSITQQRIKLEYLGKFIRTWLEQF